MYKQLNVFNDIFYVFIFFNIISQILVLNKDNPSKSTMQFLNDDFKKALHTWNLRNFYVKK